MTLFRIRWLTVFVILCVSLGFGILKQFKVAWRSVDKMTARAEPIGQRYLYFREQLLATCPPDLLRDKTITYIHDRVHATGQRPEAEFYYDLQYVMAPYLVRYRHPQAD